MDLYAFKKPSETSRICLSLLLAIFLTAAAPVVSQDDYYLEEIVVNFEVPNLIKKDIFVQYDGQTIYLPFMEIFQILEMNVTRDLSGRMFHGYMYTGDDKYEINLDKSLVKAPGEKHILQEKDYIYSDLGFYLRFDLFGTFFDLKMEFDFSQLRVLLPLNEEFPVYKKLKRKKEHDKLEAKEIALKDVERLPFRREYLKGGVIDWLITATPLGNRKTQYFDLNAGSMLLGGDLTFSGGGNTKNGIDWRQTRYHWHYFLSNSRYLTQIEAGHIFPGGPFSRSMKGFLMTNKPQVRRKYFQTIDLSGELGEGWEIELYVDGRLVDFIYTDENGNYNFNVDIFYGASTITLKMYGPNGEYKTEELNVRVPHSLIPKGEFEYSLAAGNAQTRGQNRFYSQSGCFYGLDHRLTIGIEADIPLDAAYDEEPIYGGEAVFQPLRNMTVNTYYINDYAAHAGLNYSKPSIVSVNGGFTRYYRNNFRNIFNQINNISFSVSSPLRFLGRRIGIRLHLSLDKFPERTFTNAACGVNGSFSRFHVNYIGKYKLSTFSHSGYTDKNLTSELYITAKLFRWFQPQFRLDYDHSNRRLNRYGIYLAKRIFRTGQLTFSFERNELSGNNLIMATLNLFTSFAHFTSRTVASPYQVAMSQMQRGSVRYDQETGALRFDRFNGVGYGSAILRPFLDTNFNGVLDEADEPIPGLRARVRGSGGRPVGKENLYYYDRLHPYDEYLVQIDKYSLDNPLLKPTSENYKVCFNPNMVTAIEVPIVMAGEISGMVQRQLTLGKAGAGGIRVIVINLVKGTKTEITTFNDGDFYYLGLIPGKYRAVPDPEQLSNYGYTSRPELIDFEVRATEGGDIISDINFLLVPR